MFWLAVTVLVVIGIALWWLYREPVGSADANDSAQVVTGKKAYVDHCAACHGDRLQGQPNWRVRKPDGKLPAPPHDESGHTWHHPDKQLFQITKGGMKPPLAPDGYESDMPGFADTLSDAEIWAVLAFIKSQWPEKIRARREAIMERAKK